MFREMTCPFSVNRASEAARAAALSHALARNDYLPSDQHETAFAPRPKSSVCQYDGQAAVWPL
jgi:hypothetical protein